MFQNRKSCIILAAGDGKRMNSNKPKVLMEVAFEPMLVWVIDAVIEAGESIGIDEIAVIVGDNNEPINACLERYPIISTFVQSERKGTGHAVLQAKKFLERNGGDVLILCGDAPFMKAGVIESSYVVHKSQGFSSAIITSDMENPTGYGRILRDGNKVSRIIEERDCTDEQRKITEINSGAYWVNSAELLRILPTLNNNNNNGEYYLTDAVVQMQNVMAYKTLSENVTLGANDRQSLRNLNKIAAKMICDKHLNNGVDIIGDNSFIGKDVIIGRDSVILPGTILKGNTVIGEGCTIGPNSMIENCKIGDNVILNNVQAFKSTIESNAKIGPFVHIRPNCVLRNGVKIGDFVEVKNSTIGEKTSIAHLTYVGDSDVGDKVNFGCGCVTANYDGINKYRTVIGDNAFIGCNTNLIAPVTIGENAMTAAGSTVAKDVPANGLAIERGPLNIKENWKKNLLRSNKK